MSRRVALALLILAAAGCGFPTQDSPTAIVAETPPGTAPTDSAGERPVLESTAAWFILNDQLVSITRRTPAPVDTTSALANVTAGVTAAEGTRGVRSAIPDPSMIIGSEKSGGTATVQLAAEFVDIPATDQIWALGQIVYTLTDLRGVGRVRFEIDGEAIAVPLPGGDSTQDSTSRDDFAQLATPG